MFHSLPSPPKKKIYNNTILFCTFLPFFPNNSTPTGSVSDHASHT